MKGKTHIIAKVHRTDLVMCRNSREGKSYKKDIEYLLAIRLNFPKIQSNSQYILYIFLIIKESL